MSKQVNAAVEAFWSQNNVIIASPLAASTGSAIRANFGWNKKSASTSSTSSAKNSNYQNKKNGSYTVNSPLSIDVKKNFRVHASGSCSSASSATNESVSNTGVATSGRNLVNTISKSDKNHYMRKREMSCQTMLSIPLNFDLSKIKELQHFFIDVNDADNVGYSPSKEKELNNSIRKKLFDQNSDELSTTATTTTESPKHQQVGSSSSNRNPNSLNKQAILTSINKKQSLKQLPKPQIFGTSEDDEKTHLVENEKPSLHLSNSLSSSSSSDCFDDSFEFENRQQFSSSPKQNQYRKVLCDMGDNENGGAPPPPFNFPNDSHNDSVFMPNQNHRDSTDISPLIVKTPKKQIFHFDKHVEMEYKNSNVKSNNKKDEIDNTSPKNKSKGDKSMDLSLELDIYSKSVQRQHHNRYVNHNLDSNNTPCVSNSQNIMNMSDIMPSPSSKKNKKNKSPRMNNNNNNCDRPLDSPNLSPIRVESTSTQQPSGSAFKLLLSNNQKNSKNKQRTNKSNLNNGSFQNMETHEKYNNVNSMKENSPIINSNIQNVSFTESIVAHQHDNHYKREEIFTNELIHDHISNTNKTSSINQAEISKNKSFFMIYFYFIEANYQRNFKMSYIRPSFHLSEYLAQSHGLNLFHVFHVNPKFRKIRK
jgi:hypothetical protein